MGRYDGEDYADSDGNVSSATRSAMYRARYVCNRQVFCPEGHLVGTCELPSHHYGKPCAPTHPNHGFDPNCQLKLNAEAAHRTADKDAMKLLRFGGLLYNESEGQAPYQVKETQ